MFDPQRFGKKLKAQLAGNAVGYEYASYQGTALSNFGAGGFAVISSQTQMTADRRMTVASMSKTITATAFMRTMEILNAAGGNITINLKVAPFLPSAWVRGPGVNELTFQDLLAHTSRLLGLKTEEDLFDSLKQTVANGSTSAEDEYQNCNYSLFRILIPNLLHGVGVSDEPDNSRLEAEIRALQAELAVASPAEKTKLIAQIKALQAQIDSSDPEMRTAQLYFQFVREEVLGPIGLGAVSLAPKDSGEVLEYYNFNDPSRTYKDPDFTWHLLRAGAGHWFMSAKEYARFIAGLRNGQIVSGASFDQMRDLHLAIGYANNSTRGGPNWESGGGFTKGNGAGMTGAWMILPNGWSTVILANSQGGMKKSPQEMIRNAFNAAWLAPPITDTAPAAASLGDRISAFIRADDDHVFINSARAGQPFGGWMEVEGEGITDVAPAAAALGSRLYVFVRNMGTSHISVNSALSGQPFDGWGDRWSELPGITTDAAPAAATLRDRIYVFIKGLDSRIYVNSALDGQAFGVWKPVEGDGTTDAPLGAAALGDRVYVFAKGIGTRLVYVNSALSGQRFDGWDSGWSGLPGMTTDAAPAAASLGNRIYVFIKGLDSRIYVNSALDGRAFGGWKPVEGNGTTDAALGAAALGDRIYVFGKGVNDSRVYVNSARSGQPFDGWSEVQW